MGSLHEAIGARRHGYLASAARASSRIMRAMFEMGISFQQGEPPRTRLRSSSCEEPFAVRLSDHCHHAGGALDMALRQERSQRKSWCADGTATRKPHLVKRPNSTRNRKESPPRSSSPKTGDAPCLPVFAGTCVYSANRETRLISPIVKNQ